MFLFSLRPSHTPRAEHGTVKFLWGNWRVQSASVWQDVSSVLASSRSVSFSLPDTVTNCRGWKSSNATEPRGDWDRKWRSLTRSRHTWGWQKIQSEHFTIFLAFIMLIRQTVIQIWVPAVFHGRNSIKSIWQLFSKESSGPYIKK